MAPVARFRTLGPARTDGAEGRRCQNIPAVKPPVGVFRGGQHEERAALGVETALCGAGVPPLRLARCNSLALPLAHTWDAEWTTGAPKIC